MAVVLFDSADGRWSTGKTFGSEYSIDTWYENLVQGLCVL